MLNVEMRNTALPSVSVIIPAYNAENFVLDAIRSVLQQNYSPIEVILVDDGSQDNTVARVEHEMPQVAIIRQSNAGASAARNAGLKRAAGDFVCFLDADDGWFAGKLHAQVEYFSHHPEVGLLFHEWHVWEPDKNGNYPEMAPFPKSAPLSVDYTLSGWIYPRLLLDCVVHTSTVMMRREIVNEIGLFDTRLATGEDYDYWLRVSRKYQIHKLAETYSFYRLSPSSLTGTPKLVNNEYSVIVRAIGEWGLLSPDGTSVSRQQLNRRLGKLAFDFGYSHYHSGSARIATNEFLKAFQHEPFRWRTIFYLFASIVCDFRSRAHKCYKREFR